MKRLGTAIKVRHAHKGQICTQRSNLHQGHLHFPVCDPSNIYGTIWNAPAADLVDFGQHHLHIL